MSLQVETHIFTPSTDPGYRLKLCRFREIDSLVLEFPAKGIILLDGRSSAGKTTILDSISFVLYDDVSSCYSRHDRGKKTHESTWVELTFPNQMIIYRQRRPNLLRLQYGDNVLIDDMAQAYINHLFGAPNIWAAGGYIRQYELCAFFKMSADDKLSLVQNLTSGNAHIFEQRLNKIDECITLTSQQMNGLENQVKIYGEMYMRLYNVCPENIRNLSAWSEERSKNYFNKYEVIDNNLNTLLSRIQQRNLEESRQLNQQISEEQIRLTRIYEGIKQKEQLQKRQSEIQTELDKLKVDPNSISKLEKDLQHVNEQILLAQRCERRTQLISAKTELERRFENLPPEKSIYTSSQLDTFEKILNGPSVEHLDQKIKDVHESLQYQRKYVIFTQHQELKAKIQKIDTALESCPAKSVDTEIEALTQKIYLLQLQQQKLVCPKCSTNLYLNGNNLVMCEVHTESIPDLLQKKSQYQQEEIRYRQRASLEKSLHEYKSKLSLLEVPIDFKPEDKPPYVEIHSVQLEALEKELHQQREMRSSIPNVNIGQEREKLKWALERVRLHENIQSIQKELEGLSPDSSQPNETGILEKARLEIQTELTQLRAMETRRSILYSNRDQINQQIKLCPIDNPDESQLNTLKNKMEINLKESQQLIMEVQAQIQLKQLVELYNQHAAVQRTYTELGQKLAGIQKIRATLITAEYVILDHILSRLNRKIAQIIPQLFMESISVTIRSLKQLKTDGRIKPQINCEIIYEGVEGNKITETSGGERMRVSVVLAIAIARFSSVPFLLLDESLASLDVNTKEMTMKVIRKYLGNKLVIAVNHDTTVGVYDAMIKIIKK